MKIDRYVTGTGQILTNIHPQENCQGWCVIHNPHPGPWDAWLTHWRPADEIDSMFGMYRGFERICRHGVGHPAVEEILRGNRGVHSCCGCLCSLLDLEERNDQGTEN